VAEGVETTAQLAWLRAQGCDTVQGFLLGAPTSTADFEAGLAVSRANGAKARSDRQIDGPATDMSSPRTPTSPADSGDFRS
jgi:predicted signal transduction protein with EAL and GGDEF domain